MQRKLDWEQGWGENTLVVSLLQHTVAYGEQGWGSGESTRLPPILLSFIS